MENKKHHPACDGCKFAKFVRSLRSGELLPYCDKPNNRAGDYTVTLQNLNFNGVCTDKKVN